jgi:hypothetical protein
VSLGTSSFYFQFVSNVCFISGWTTIDITVTKAISDADYFYSQFPVYLGTPPQRVDLTIGTASTLLAAWSSDCVFCPGGQLFDPSASSTLQVSKFNARILPVSSTSKMYHITVTSINLRLVA